MDVGFGNKSVYGLTKEEERIDDFSYFSINPEVKYIITPEGSDGLLYISVEVPTRSRSVAYKEGTFLNYALEERYGFSYAKQGYQRTSVALKLGAQVRRG